MTRSPSAKARRQSYERIKRVFPTTGSDTLPSITSDRLRRTRHPEQSPLTGRRRSFHKKGGERSVAATGPHTGGSGLMAVRSGTCGKHG